MEITKIQFRNLVFEGGGVKGLGYVGAMRYLNEHGYLNHILRVGGTSAGAINALLFALGLDIETQWKIMKQLDFNKFKDCPWWIPEGCYNLFCKFGWYRGDFFKTWIEGLIQKKLGNRRATFADLLMATGKELFVVSTNLSTGYAEVFSPEKHPNMPVADAVRMSMSIPMFFAARRFGSRKDVFVDGGLVLNYPVKLFDREKYILEDEKSYAILNPGYYNDHNAEMLKQEKTKNSSKFVYNKQTLGMRVDTEEEIGLYRYNEPVKKKKISSFNSYVAALLKTVMLVQENQHIHSDDWERTLYIDCKEVQVTDFDITDDKKDEIIQSGYTGAVEYFDWFFQQQDDPDKVPKNKIL